MADDTDSLSSKLAAAHETARLYRCESFVDYRPIVAGEVLTPITLATYNALIAFRNAFVTGGPIGFEDIANFVWLHSPAFGQFNRKEKARITRRVYVALRPPFPTLNDLARVIGQFPGFRSVRRLAVPTTDERIAETIVEIRRLIAEATQDLPTGDEGGEPIPFAFAAYIQNLFRRELGLTFEDTNAIPTRPELQAVSDRISAIEATFAVMAEQNRTNERQDQKLADHETRIRALEFNRR